MKNLLGCLGLAHVVGLSHATTAQLPSVFADCCRTPVDLVAKLNQMVSEIRASVSVQSPAAQGLLVGSATMRQVPDADALRRREVKTYLAGLKTIAHQLGNGFSRAEASQAANVMRDLCSRLKVLYGSQAPVSPSIPRRSALPPRRSRSPDTIGTAASTLRSTLGLTLRRLAVRLPFHSPAVDVFAQWERMSAGCEADSQLSSAFADLVIDSLPVEVPVPLPPAFTEVNPPPPPPPASSLASEASQEPTAGQLAKHIQILQQELDTLRKSSVLFSEAVVQLKEGEIDRKAKEMEISELKDDLRRADEREQVLIAKLRSNWSEAPRDEKPVKVDDSAEIKLWKDRCIQLQKELEQISEKLYLASQSVHDTEPSESKPVSSGASASAPGKDNKLRKALLGVKSSLLAKSLTDDVAAASVAQDIMVLRPMGVREDVLPIVSHVPSRATVIKSRPNSTNASRRGSVEVELEEEVLSNPDSIPVAHVPFEGQAGSSAAATPGHNALPAHCARCSQLLQQYPGADWETYLEAYEDKHVDGRVVLGPAKNRDALSKRPLSFPADCPFAHLVQWTVEENDELMAALDPSLVVPEGPEDEEPPAAKVAVPKETPTAIASLLKQISVIIDEKSRAVQAANLNGLQPPSLPRVVFMKLLQDHGSKEVASAEGRTFISSLVRSRRTVPTVDLFTRFLEGRYSDEQFQFFLFLRTAIATTEVGNDYPPADPTTEPALLCSFRASLVIRGIARVFRFCSRGDSVRSATLPRVPSQRNVSTPVGIPADDLPADSKAYSDVTGYDDTTTFLGTDSAVKNLISKVMVMSRRAKGPGFEERLSFDAIAGDLVPPRKLCDERWYVSYHDFVRMAVEEYGTQRMLRWQRAWKFWEASAKQFHKAALRKWSAKQDMWLPLPQFRELVSIVFQNVVNPASNMVAVNLTAHLLPRKAPARSSGGRRRSEVKVDTFEEDFSVIHALSAYYSDSLQGVDWNGFARAAQELRLFSDDTFATPMFSEQYTLLQDQVDPCRIWLESALTKLPGTIRADLSTPGLSRPRLQRLFAELLELCKQKGDLSSQWYRFTHLLRLLLSGQLTSVSRSLGVDPRQLSESFAPTVCHIWQQLASLGFLESFAASMDAVSSAALRAAEEAAAQAERASQEMELM